MVSVVLQSRSDKLNPQITSIPSSIRGLVNPVNELSVIYHSILGSSLELFVVYYP